MQQINRYLVASVLFATLSFAPIHTTYAAELTTDVAVESILSANTGFYKTEEGVQIDIQEEATQEWHNICNQLINKVFRGCDPSEMGTTIHYRYLNNPKKNSYLIRTDQIEKLAKRQQKIDEWIEAVSPMLFTDGMSRDEAIQIAFLHIVNNYPYDYELYTSGDQARARDAQGAYYVIENQKGICASLTKLFREIVESIPLDETGHVNWNIETSEHISVSVLTSLTHEWAAINLDGTTYFYDCAETGTDKLQTYKMTIDTLTSGPYSAYYDLENATWAD